MGRFPLVIHGNVDALGGDVHHDGDVRVLGSVGRGTRLIAAGDVTVVGGVDGATVEAGGDLRVHGIATGSGATLDAVGSVIVRQAEDTVIRAGLDVVVRAVAERCTISAGRRVLVTGAPGLVAGGVVAAGAGIEVVRATASCGERAELRAGRAEFDEERERIEERARFAREQEMRAELREASEASHYRRQAAELSAFRSLRVSLGRRLRQLKAAGPGEDTASVLITGTGPVDADVRLGEHEDVLSGRPERLVGAVLALLDGDELRVGGLEELARVG